MADESTQAAAPVDASQQPQAGTPPTTAPQAGTDTTQTTTDTSTDDVARLKKELEQTRKEAANYRKRAQEYDAAQKAAEEAKLGDLEKAQKQAEALAAQAKIFRDALAAAKLENAAIKSNAIDSDAVVALLAGKLDFGDDGQPTNVDELLDGIKKAKPLLFKSADAPARAPITSGGASNPGRGNQPTPVKTPAEMARFGTGQTLFKR